MKQCEHCRTARKSKSQHGKCDCGDKKDKDRIRDTDDSKYQCRVNPALFTEANSTDRV